MSGCAKNQTNDKDLEALVITMPKTSEPDTGFDPIYGWACAEHVSEPLIQSTLIKTDADLNIECDLATTYVISDDAKQITFTLRDDVAFTNGDKLSAHDVAFTINSAKENAANPADFSSIEAANATDDDTCVVTLAKADNTVLYSLANLGIVPENSYDASTYGKNPIGSGRYKLDSWDKGRSATFVANENYYGDSPNIKKFTVLFLDEDASFAYAMAGDADVAYIPAKYSSQEVPDCHLLSVETNDSRGISLPTKTKKDATEQYGNISEYEGYELGCDVTADFAVRYAINLATNRQKLIENTMFGQAKSAYSVCDSLPWKSDSMKIETDVEAAKTTLNEAGWVKEEGSEYRSKEGRICEFDLYYAASDSDRQALAYAFADQMKAIGVKVNAIGKSWDEIYAHQYSDAVLWGWGNNSPSEVVSIIKSDGACNFSLSGNKGCDDLIDEAISKSDLNESFDLLKQAQSQQSPENASSWVWLANVNHCYFVKNGVNVAGQKKHPHGHGWSLVNNIDKWTVD